MDCSSRTSACVHWPLFVFYYIIKVTATKLILLLFFETWGGLQLCVRTARASGCRGCVLTPWSRLRAARSGFTSAETADFERAYRLVQPHVRRCRRAPRLDASRGGSLVPSAVQRPPVPRPVRPPAPFRSEQGANEQPAVRENGRLPR